MTRAETRTRPGRSSNWITRTKRLAVYIRDGFTCMYCGRDLRNVDPAEVHLDHLNPRKHDGSHDTKNLITACRRCNCGRKHKPWRKYATAGAVARIERQVRRKLNLDLARALVRGEVTREEC